MLIINIKINNTTSSNDLHASIAITGSKGKRQISRSLAYMKKILVLAVKSMLQVLYLKIFALFVSVLVKKFFFTSGACALP